MYVRFKVLTSYYNLTIATDTPYAYSMAKQQNADIAVRIPQELRDAIDHIAEEQDRPISRLIREALKRYVTEHDGQDTTAAA